MKLVPAYWKPVLALAVLIPDAGAFGQQFAPIKVPDASPEASVGQTIGITEVRISYHRPAVNKREVWGKLIPYNEVWRAGANENTTISFSSDVAVAGQKLAAGTYGLHMLPTEKDWTVIFSNMANAWGSFSYEPNENFSNLRVKAGLLEKKGDVKAAEALRARSLPLATENEMNNYGYQLLAQKKMDEAIEAFRKNVKDHPASWNVYDSLAEAYATKGDKKLATDYYNKALSMAPESQKKRITDALAKLKA